MHRPTDVELDASVAGMLRCGVGLAALVVLAGGILLLLRASGPSPSFRHFNAGGPALRTVAGVWRGLRVLDPGSLIQCGLLILIATPVARVVFCVVGFARQRSGLYVAIGLFVLSVLTYSLLHTNA